MANTANLRGYLSDLANAIRHVSGLNNNIPANQYDLIINNFILSNETSLNITPSTIAQNFGAPAGYSGYNSINVAPVTSNIDPNIVPAYILNGINILGVVGNYDVPLSNIDIAPSTNIQNIIAPAGTGYNVINIGAVTANIDSNITPEHIANGVNILGVIGTLEEGSDVSGVTAIAGDVRETKKFVTSSGELLQGTFPDATPVYSEITLDAQKVVNPINNNGSATYFDGNWYSISGEDLIIATSTETFTITNAVPLFYDNTEISVGCKNCFGENTVALAYTKRLSSGSSYHRIGFDVINLETKEVVVHKGSGADSWYGNEMFVKCLHPNRPYLALTMGGMGRAVHVANVEVNSKFWGGSDYAKAFIYSKSFYQYTDKGFICNRLYLGGNIFSYEVQNTTDDIIYSGSAILNFELSTGSDYNVDLKNLINASNTFCLIETESSTVKLYSCTLNNYNLVIDTAVEYGTYVGNIDYSQFISDDVFAIVNSQNTQVSLYKIISSGGSITVTRLNDYELTEVYKTFPKFFYIKDNEKYSFYTGTTEVLSSFLYQNKNYLDTSYANAVAANLLSGKTAYVGGNKITGTMPNSGIINIIPSTETQIIPAGYTSGGTVSGEANLVKANIRSGVTIFGVEGNLEPDKPDQTKTVNPSTSQQVIEPDTGYELSSVTINAVTANIDPNIVPEKIANGVNILGVIGTAIGANLTTLEVLTNGTYTPPTGYDGFSSVNVMVPSMSSNIFIQTNQPATKQGIWINTEPQAYTLTEINEYNASVSYGSNQLLVVKGFDLNTKISGDMTYYFNTVLLSNASGDVQLPLRKYRGTGTSWEEIEDNYSVLTPEEAIEANSTLDNILGQPDQGDTDNLTPDDDIIANQLADDILGNN